MDSNTEMWTDVQWRGNLNCFISLLYYDLY